MTCSCANAVSGGRGGAEPVGGERVLLGPDPRRRRPVRRQRSGRQVVLGDLEGAAATREADLRRPHLLETVWPGVFAAGDVRAGATKRVSGAVGDGALAVRFAHQVLQA